MIKLSEKVLSNLGKVPKTKPKAKNVVDGVNIASKKYKKRLHANVSSPLERAPKEDTFVSSSRKTYTKIKNDEIPENKKLISEIFLYTVTENLPKLIKQTCKELR